MQTKKIDQRKQRGPFDIIGDIHGCFDELSHLLKKLGYKIIQADIGGSFQVMHPEERKVVFLGDLVDRGPKITAVLKLAMSMKQSGIAYCLAGNHDDKLCRKLQGRNVQVKHGLEESLRQLGKEPPGFVNEVRDFLYQLPHHFLFDAGRLVVAHAGMKEHYQGLDSEKIRQFAMFGETTGETDIFGLPVRYNWAGDYRGKAIVVYGHTPVAEAVWQNGTIDIDTGCVFGGKLTALRYPELELVSVPARYTYYETARQFLPKARQAPDYPGLTVHEEPLHV